MLIARIEAAEHLKEQLGGSHVRVDTCPEAVVVQHELSIRRHPGDDRYMRVRVRVGVRVRERVSFYLSVCLSVWGGTNTPRHTSPDQSSAVFTRRCSRTKKVFGPKLPKWGLPGREAKSAKAGQTPYAYM